jgi:hypothetical protein
MSADRGMEASSALALERRPMRGAALSRGRKEGLR